MNPTSFSCIARLLLVSPRGYALTVASFFSAFAVSIAAESPSRSAAAAAEVLAREEAVQLSAFEVTADANDSYEALNTASITGTNRSIRSLPVTMNAYTRTFLDEIN